MGSPERAVRVAAQALHLAITAARAAGLVVAWPRRADDLPAIAISETAKSPPPPPPDRPEIKSEAPFTSARRRSRKPTEGKSA